MDVRATFVADRQAPIAIEPGQCAFHHPAMPTQSLTRLDAAAGKAGNDATLAAGGATGGAAARIVVALVGMPLERTTTRSPTRATRLADGWDRVQGSLEQPRVVNVGRREDHRERDAGAVNDQMAFASRLAAVGGIGAGLLAPLFAGTLAESSESSESSEARDQSSLSASARRCNNSRWRRSHTPARFQSRRRRQHVIRSRLAQL
jgi:hypothetical protein